MPISRNSAPRWRTVVAAALLMLLSCSSGGCAKRVVYVNGDHQLIKLKTGESAPRPGVLISE